MMKSQEIQGNDQANVAVFPPLPFVLAVVVGVLTHVLWEPFRFFPEIWIGHAAGWPLIVAAIVLIAWAQRTMAGAGEKAGLPAELAMQLARTTVSGAGELARLADEPASKLRENVTSPAGTTLEALKILMAEDGIQPLFDAAIAAATRRSRELAG